MKTSFVIIIGAALSSLFLAVIPAFAQSTMFTYQGRVLDNGTNFTGTGLFKFALVTSTNTSQQATAAANPPSGGFITVINVSFGGSGYLSAPGVVITGGGGANATATARISGSGVVTNIIVNNPGSDYTSTPTVTVAPPPANILITTWWTNDGTSVNGSEPGTAVSVSVTNGLFTVVLGDTMLANMTAIPTSLFTEPNLQLRIWFNDGVNGSVALSPLQNLTPTPYAVYASLANTASNVLGTLGNGNFPASPVFSGTLTANSFAGNGAGLTNVNAATLGGLGPNNFWHTSGNSGTTAGPNFVGTADNQPLELHVSGARALLLVPDPRGSQAANIIGGYISNAVQQPGSGGDFIGSGGDGSIPNTIHSNSSGVFIGAGSLNQVGPNVDDSVIAGGFGNTIQDWDAVIAGGQNNTVQANNSVIGGGDYNVIQFIDQGGTAGSTISGGEHNTIQVDAYDSTISGGYLNTIQTNAQYSIIGGGEGNIVQANCSWSFIGGGFSNLVDNGAQGATIGGGGGGLPFVLNHISSTLATVSGGSGNVIQGFANDSTIGGGRQNEIDVGAWGAVISGGHSNWVQFGLVGGGNSTNSSYSTISGGYGNTIQANANGSVISGGLQNTAAGIDATVPGGFQNTAAGVYSFAAGQQARALHQGAFVWADSQATSFSSTSNDQFCIRAQGGVQYDPSTSLFFGSQTRQMLNLFDFPTGTNYAIGVQDSTLYFRVGNELPVTGFAWYRGGLHNDNQTNSGGGNTLMTLNHSGLTVNGTFVSTSDRNAKEHFQPIDAREALKKVTSLPITTWNFKDDPTTRHVGPMAQDFYAAFDVGPDDRHIATVDEGGVALAAIQGLNQKLEESRAENAELKARLDKLEQLLNSRLNGGER